MSVTDGVLAKCTNHETCMMCRNDGQIQIPHGKLMQYSVFCYSI